MKKNALNSQRLKGLFPPPSPAYEESVQHTLQRLQSGKEIPVMKKKLSLGLVLVLILSLLVAAILSPTADIFGLLYGKEKHQALLKGDIATLGDSHPFDDLDIVLEEAVYQSEGDMQGLYGTGLIKPREGANVVLMAEDYSINDPAGYPVHYGLDLQIPEDAPTYADLAAQKKAQLLSVRVLPDSVSIGGLEQQTDAGSSLMPQQDGSVRFAFEMQIPRAAAYNLKLHAGYMPLDSQGRPGDYVGNEWTVEVKPSLSATAQAAIAAQTPVAPPTAAPSAAPGALKLLNPLWGEVEPYMVQHPDRPVEQIRLEYGEGSEYLRNPDNPWDVTFLSLEDGDFDRLAQQGHLADLSGDDTIATTLDSMYPAIRQAVSHNGKLYGVPYALFSGGDRLQGAGEEIWAKVGWTMDKQPATFEQLTALAQEYMQLPLATRKGTRFLLADSPHGARSLLLRSLVSLYMQENLAAATPLTFDTPQFRAALSQLEAAAKALVDRQAAPDSKGAQYALIGSAGNNFQQGNDLVLRIGDKAAATGRLTVCVVNAHSPNREAALHYAAWLSQNISSQFLPSLDANITCRQIAEKGVAQDIASREALHKIHGYDQEEDLRIIKQWQASGDIMSYAPTEEALTLYRDHIAPGLVVLKKPLPPTYPLEEQYLLGKLTTDAFIQALDALAKEAGL